MNTTVPPPQRRRRARDLALALRLRPRDVFALYGIPQSTLSQWANDADPARRPPSILIRSRGRRKGMRLFPRAAFEAWLDSWTSDGVFTAAKSRPSTPKAP